ncbi:hypothetical protein SAMN05660199_00226 [Klenkia soli]|uniref:Uncharacterized protein n=1 Tax=Klenkia soli TaxID=1052260 RepID=A0A1H0C758_9ACTN|nr:hypothetical protein [Klenkia soli]SDN53718.1 hypothetical protein SAMN05660199_00226 [Klenkia soli]
MTEQQHGVVFPAGPDGRRSTAAVGRTVVADALREVDPTGARAAERETNWRSGYLPHVRRTTEVGLGSRTAARQVAAAGLESVHRQLRVVVDGAEVGLDVLRHAAPAGALGTETVTGTAEPERELTLPFRGRRLRGAELSAQLADWVDRGVVEPSCATAVETVAAHPEWLALPGRTVAVLGAGAEMGPLTALLRWGATVAAVDLPRPPLWDRVLDTARRGAGTVLVPTRDGARGADLIGEVPAVADWLGGLDGVPVLGNYVYADGAVNVRVSAAVDVLTLRLQGQRPDLEMAFLATPTDVFVVPEEAVAASVAAYAGRGRAAKLLGRPLRTVSGGRLLQRAYPRDADGPGIADSLVPQQGPNYALAKRLQRWRATTARAAGTTVSMNVAPPTRTRSVLKNRALAAAYAGAHRFGVEVFDPATSNVLMAALLVHDLHTGGGPDQDEPWQDEAHAAAHGGLWRTPYAPRSALGLAAVLGVGAARS